MSFKPRVDVELGGQTRTLEAGFSEVQQFEQLSGLAFAAAFSGTPKFDSVIKFAVIGLKRHEGAISEKKVAGWLDQTPGDFLPLIKAIATLASRFFEGATDEDEEEDRPLSVAEDVRGDDSAKAS